MSARKKLPCIVTRAGVPQRLVPLLTARVRSGVLLPAAGEPATVFSNRDCAARAILRTQDAAGTVKGSFLEGWSKLAPLTDPTPYTIVAVAPSTKGATC